MAQGLIDRTTLEAATEGVQVLGKVFLRALLREASENGWFVDVTNDTQTFMRPDRDALGMIFGPGGSTPHDVAFTRLGSESYGFMNSGLTYHTDLRVRNMESTVVPHANVKAWGAAGDGAGDDRGEIVNALTALKNAGGGELYFPPGTYRMSTGISISDLKGVTIRGAGMTSSTLRIADVAARHFTLTAAENITFRDLTFDRVNNTVTAGIGGINMPKGGNSFNEGHRFENLHFGEMTDTSLEIETPRGLVISNVRINHQTESSAVDLLTPFSTTIHSLVMTDCEQRGLYLRGFGRDVSVQASRAVGCGIGFEASQCVVVFNACTAYEGVNFGASYPGYGFVAGDTYSQVTLMNTSVVSTAGITAYIETTGAVIAKFNALELMAGVTTTQTTIPSLTSITNVLTCESDCDVWGLLNCFREDTLTSNVKTIAAFAHRTTNTPVDGFGAELAFSLDNVLPGGSDRVGALKFIWDDVTARESMVVIEGLNGAGTLVDLFTLSSVGLLAVSDIYTGSVKTTGQLMALGTDSSHSLVFRTNTANRWQISASGHILASDDDTYNIGSTAARPKLIYAATAFVQGTDPASAGSVRLEHEGSILHRNSTNTANKNIITASGDDKIIIGAQAVRAGLPGNKTTTGDPTGIEGLLVINTFDNVVRMYADGAWRTLASW